MKKISIIAFVVVAVILITSCTHPRPLDHSNDSEDINSSDEKFFVSSFDISFLSDKSKNEDESFGTDNNSEASELEINSKSDDQSGEVSSEYLTNIEAANTDNYSVVIQSITLKGDYANVLLVIENKTKRDSAFSFGGVYVNGCSVQASFGTIVLAGKKSIKATRLSLNELDKIGVKAIDELIIPFCIYGPTTIEAEFEIIKAYPTGKDPNSILYPNRAIQKNDIVLIDDEICQFVVYETSYSENEDLIFKCYIENKTDITLGIDWDDVTVNDYMCDPYFYIDLVGGTHAYTEIQFKNKELEKVGNSPYSIEALVRAYDSVNMSYPDILSQEVSIAVD